MKLEQWLGEGNELGVKIWNDKYRHEDENFEEFVERVGNGNWSVEKLIKERKFLPAGRILANINTGTKQGISNCVTFGYVEDDLQDIMRRTQELAFSFAAEAGVGVNFSKIRPKGAKIGKAGHTADGVMGFIRIFEAVAANISRGGARRGAMLTGLDATHPDVMEYIKAKKNNSGADGVLLSCNMSVTVDDEFMRNLQERKTYRKDFLVEATGEVIEHYVDPVAIMDAIVDEPRKAHEPAILFKDRYNEYHLYGDVIPANTMFNNACTEFVGMDGTTCLLGSMNVAEFVGEGGVFQWERFKSAVAAAVEYLDSVHDYGMTRNGVELQNEMSRKYRGIGLGVMGFADMLIKKGINYSSLDAKRYALNIAKVMKQEAIDTSRKLAMWHGQPEGIKEFEELAKSGDAIIPQGLRNSSLLSIAPSGSIGTMLGVSTGVEPVFRAKYTRKTESLNSDGTPSYHEVYHKAIEEELAKRAAYAEEHDIVLGYPSYCVDSSQIDYKDKVGIINAFQQHVDLAISNTTNLPSTATTEDIKDMYLRAWKGGAVGVTCYVDGALEGVMNEIKEEEKCPECDSALNHTGGCTECPSCGWSKCSIV